MSAFLATAKRKGTLQSQSPEQLKVEADAAFWAWDHGPYPDLSQQVAKRQGDKAKSSGQTSWAPSSKRLAPAPAPSQSSTTTEGEADAAATPHTHADACQCEQPNKRAKIGDEVAAAVSHSWDGGGSEVGEAYKRAWEHLRTHVLGRGTDQESSINAKWWNRRFERALGLFRTMRAPVSITVGDVLSSTASTSSSGPAGLPVPPNARSYVLLLHGALQAGRQEEGKLILSAMTHPEHGVCTVSRLWEVCQPSLLASMAQIGWISEGQLRDLLCPQPHTLHWNFLKAAWEAGKGDQYGSKHGATVASMDWRFLTSGRNHRFAVPGDPHLRVMHSEVHGLIRLLERAGQKQDSEGALLPSMRKQCSTDSVPEPLGCQVLIVELDGCGVGYELAIPCAMCAKALCRLGVAKAVFSSHSGLVTNPVNFKPALECESLSMARIRTYPEGTQDPDGLEEEAFHFWDLVQEGSSQASWADPGKGKEFAQAAKAAKTAAKIGDAEQS